MNKEYILQEVKKASEVSIDLRDLYDMPEFKTGKEESSLESLVLTLSGHSPIKIYSFDIKKLEVWCEENSLRFCLYEMNRLLHLKVK
jgi:hypothetical protein